MLFKDVRHNTYHLINKPFNWSTDWNEFAGIPLAFSFEKDFRIISDERQEWLRDHWHYSVYICIVYIIAIWILTNLMKIRYSPYNLRFPLAIWSSSLAVFSILGTIKCLPEFIYILRKKGITASFCESSYYEVSEKFKNIIIITLFI